MEIWPYKMRELVLMHEGKMEAEWSQTSHILAALYNIPPAIGGLFGKKGKERKPEEFMPDFVKQRAKSQRSDPPRVDIGILKTVFIDRRMPDVSRLEPRHNRG